MWRWWERPHRHALWRKRTRRKWCLTLPCWIYRNIFTTNHSRISTLSTVIIFPLVRIILLNKAPHTTVSLYLNRSVNQLHNLCTTRSANPNHVLYFSLVFPVGLTGTIKRKNMHEAFLCTDLVCSAGQEWRAWGRLRSRGQRRGPWPGKTGSPCSRDLGRLCHRSPLATGSHDMESGYRGERERRINIHM